MVSKHLIRVAAVAGLVIGGRAIASPMVNLSLTIEDASQNPITPVGGVYHVPQGSDFYVVLGASVSTPNQTAAVRTVNPNKPLGFNTVVTTLTSSTGTTNATAEEDSPGSGSWLFNDLTPGGIQNPATSFNIVGGKPSGIGTVFTPVNPTNTANYNRASVGVSGVVPILNGAYFATAAGTFNIHTGSTSANAYQDNSTTAGGSTLQAIASAFADATANIQIDAAPVSTLAQILDTQPGTTNLGTMTIPGNHSAGYVEQNLAVPSTTMSGNVGFNGIDAGDPVVILLDLTDNTKTAALVAALTALSAQTPALTEVSSSDPLIARYNTETGKDYNVLLQFTQRAGAGTDFFNFDFSQISGGVSVQNIGAVPEPASFGLIGVAAIGLLVRKRRQNVSARP